MNTGTKLEPVIRMSPDKFKIFPNFIWADRKITVFAMLQQ